MTVSTCLFIRRLGSDPLERAWRPGRRLSETTLSQYLAAVSTQHNVSPADVMGQGRYRYMVAARQDLMWRLRQAGFSYLEIGRALDRDHNTVQMGCRKHAARAGVVHRLSKLENPPQTTNLPQVLASYPEAVDGEARQYRPMQTGLEIA